MASNPEDPSSGVLRADNAKLAHEIDNYAEVIHDAEKADYAEHNMSIRDAFRIHKKAVFWSVFLSAALIMEGYDVVVVRLPSNICVEFRSHPRRSAPSMSNQHS